MKNLTKWMFCAVVAASLAFAPEMHADRRIPKPTQGTAPVKPVKPVKPAKPVKPGKPVTVGAKLTLNKTTMTLSYGNNTYRLVKVPGGTFKMGATGRLENDAYDDEYPVHSVTLSQYYMGATEVPQWLWKAVMGSNPSEHVGDMLPVDNVSWREAQEFISKLNKKVGYTFRLPTEAEWEFAARGGNNDQGYLYSGSNTIGEVAWYEDNSGDATHPVGKKKANALGLYDMSGNVWEWCQDWYGDYPDYAVTNPTGPSTGERRVIRSSGYSQQPEIARVSDRGCNTEDAKVSFNGLRLTAGGGASAPGTTASTGLKWNSGTSTITYGNRSYKMVKVPGGSFTMGATGSLANDDAYSDEYPTHRVTLSQYWMGATEVPQWLWKAVMGSNPSEHVGDSYPVDNISWNDCQEFIRKLNSLTGANFRLPTEAEWEYAARGGSSSSDYIYSGSNYIGSVAWYEGNSDGETHQVGTKTPNALGLYDMSGNVWEWVFDFYDAYSSGAQTNPTGPSTGTNRVLRSSGFSSSARIARITDRGSNSVDARHGFNGMRLAMGSGANTSSTSSSSSSSSLSPSPSSSSSGGHIIQSR